MLTVFFQKIALLCCLLFLTANASAQISSVKNTAWPKQAIRIVVTFPAGGAPDILARVLAESWQPILNVPVLIENRPGVGGNIGADIVAKSNPDGYTLLIGTVGIHAINGALYNKMPFDPIADFTPISFLASTPNVLVVNKQLGVTTLRDLIALAKSKPNS
jgi:tripartite-type tricarboxylate transporter receptor subunit TctC